MDTQVAPFFLESARANRPAPEITPLGYIFHANDTLETFVRAVDPTTNLPRWDSIGGSSSGSLSSKYWVNAAGQIPVVGYTTIQSAVNAAVADGHNDTNPAVIIILPGTYTENVTLAPGISLFSPINGYIGTTLIIGNVSADLIASGTNSLSNILIVGAFTARHLLPSTQIIFMNNVIVNNTSGDGVALAGDGMSFIARGCDFEGGGGRGLTSDNNLSGDVNECSISGSAEGVAVSGNWSFTLSSFRSDKGVAITARPAGAVSPSVSYHGCEWNPGNGQAAFEDSSAAGVHRVYAPATFNMQNAKLYLFAAGVRIHFVGATFLGNYSVANLPDPTNISSGGTDTPPSAYATNGCSPSESTTRGSGVMVEYVIAAGLNTWCTVEGRVCGVTTIGAGSSASPTINDSRIVASPNALGFAQVDQAAPDATLTSLSTQLGPGTLVVHGNANAAALVTIAWQVFRDHMPVIS